MAKKHLAVAALATHREEEALKAAQAAVSQEPADTQAKVLLVIAMIRNGNFAHGVSLAEQIPSWESQPHGFVQVVRSAQQALAADVSIRKGYESGSVDNFRVAAGQLEAALRTDPQNAAMRKTLGWLYLDKAGDPKQATGHLARVLASNPADLDTQKMFALACSGSGRLEQAVTVYRSILVKDPRDLWIRLNFARTLARLERYAQAKALYEEVLRVDPHNADARLGLAEISAWQWKYVEAEDHCRSVLAEEPNKPAALALLGDMYRWAWRMSTAKDEYELATRAVPNYYAAVDGLREIGHMYSPRVTMDHSQFEDSGEYLTAVSCVHARVPLSDNAYVSGGVLTWRFKQPPLAAVERLDETIGLEYHVDQRLEASMSVSNYAYDGADCNQVIALAQVRQ